MNKKLFLSALASTALLASCVENDLGSNENLSANSNGDGRIGFNYKVGNMTRATELAQNAGHYEFGVYAFKGATAGSADVSVMDNYLVAYGEASNNLYDPLKTQASTYGTNAGGDYTDVENKVSSWFYEGIGKTAVSSGDGLTWGNTGYTVPDANQVLKYWDKNQNVHDYYAFMPYASKTVVSTTNPTQVTYASNALTFTDINAFSTSTNQVLNTASGYQIAGARAEHATAGALDKVYAASATPVVADYNKELLNYNEGLYASTSVAKANYDKDVELTFKHINAKVNIAFYEEIKGYKVELIDLVPTSTGSLTPAKGVQFSPAALQQAEQTMNDKQPTLAELPTYINKGTVVVGNLNKGTETMTITGTPTNKNLIFEATNKPLAPVPGTTNSRPFIGETRTGKTVSATTMYVLPNQFGTPAAYITPDNTDQYNYYVGKGASAVQHKTAASTKLADQTGYTLHVSFRMIPQDGSADITIYDARVYVAPQYCKWEAGKAYTYIFKITDRANGVTDPSTVDPSTSGTGSEEPWIDPEDPRVPDDPVLTPIVFDGVTVTNYEDVNTGKENDVDEWVIADPDTWTFFLAGGSGDKTYYDNSGVYGKTAVTDVLKRFNIAASPITSVQWNETNKNFDVDLADGTASNYVPFEASSYVNESQAKSAWVTAGVTITPGTMATEVSALITDALVIEVAKPAFNVWSSETQAVPYVTTPATITLDAYDVKYLVTTEFTTGGGVTYELGKYISPTIYASLTSSEQANITVTAKFKPTVTYETTAISAGSAAAANSAYLIVTKK